MDILNRLYDFLSGPCLYLTIPLTFAGLARKIFIIQSGLKNGLRFSDPHSYGYVASGSEGGEGIISVSPLAARAPLLFWISFLFHIAIFAAPVTARAHGILLDLAWGIMPPRFATWYTEFFTLTAVITGLILLVRRTFTRHVLAVSSWRDYASMLCVLSPFVTGFMAREMIGSYELVMIFHFAGAHVLLLAIGWTRLGHMVFFTAGSLVKSGMIKVTKR